MKSVIFIFLLFVLIGCRSHYATYELVNDTSFNIEIEAFDSQRNVSSDIISMSPNSTREFSRLSGESTDPRTFFSIDGVDSVNIVFDAKRVLIQTCNDFRNYMDCSAIFTSTEVTITEEDYKSAIPIE